MKVHFYQCFYFCPCSWVGYPEADFEGQQFILEEGEYPHWSEWGGCEDKLMSFRPIRTVNRHDLSWEEFILCLQDIPFLFCTFYFVDS